MIAFDDGQARVPGFGVTGGGALVLPPMLGGTPRRPMSDAEPLWYGRQGRFDITAAIEPIKPNCPKTAGDIRIDMLLSDY